MKAFISYSHKDENYLQKLQINLAQVKRQGLLQEWTDHDIEAGDRFNEKIIKELDLSQLFLALVSSDYIHSNFCFEKEFKQAQQLEHENKIIIVPIICRPCDWKNTPFSKFNALPKDGKAISDWQNEDSAFFNIIEMLRPLIKQPSHSPTIVGKQAERTSRKFEGSYKVRKDFDIVQKSNFVDKTFEEVKTLLKDYLEELAPSENVFYKILNDTNNNLKSYLVNRDISIVQCECIFKKSEEKSSSYHFNYNEGELSSIFVKENREESISFSLSNDEYEMFFLSRSMFGSRNDEKKYDSKSIANEIWRKWLTQIGIDIF